MALSKTFKGPKGDTIVWGSSGVYTEGVIVDTGDENALVIEEKIEDNDGFTAVLILLDDGSEVKVTFVWETGMTPPAIGASVEIFDSENYVITGRSKAAKRKSAMMMTVTAKRFYATEETTP